MTIKEYILKAYLEQCKSYLEQCKYKLKKRKIIHFIDDEIIDEEDNYKFIDGIIFSEERQKINEELRYNDENSLNK